MFQDFCLFSNFLCVVVFGCYKAHRKIQILSCKKFVDLVNKNVEYAIMDLKNCGLIITGHL